MCHAIPAQVIEVLNAEQAKVEVGGVHQTVSTALVDSVTVGDYLIIHVGFALEKLDPDEADATLAALAELATLNETGSA